MGTSRLWQKVGASAVNCSLVLLLSLGLYPFVSVEIWKISTIAIFFIYNVLFRSRCLGMRMMGTYIEPPTSIWYATLYSLGFSTFFYSVWIPGDLLTANAVIQIGSVTMTGNTAHGLLASQGTMTREQYLEHCKRQARLLLLEGRQSDAVHTYIADLGKYDETAMPLYIANIGEALLKDGDEYWIRHWIDGIA